MSQHSIRSHDTPAWPLVTRERPRMAYTGLFYGLLLAAIFWALVLVTALLVKSWIA